MNECHWSFLTAAADFLFKCIDDAFDSYGKHILTKKFFPASSRNISECKKTVLQYLIVTQR